MSKVTQSGNGKQAKAAQKRLVMQREQQQLLEDVLTGTVHEMIIDLAKAEPALATRLLQVTQGFKNSDLSEALRVKDSELCKVIMEACASPSMKEQGPKYLTIFAMIQPALSVVSSPGGPTSTEMDVVTTAVVSKDNSVTKTLNSKIVDSKPVNNKKKKKGSKKKQDPASSSSNPSELIQGLLSDTQDKDLLLSLADSIFKDLDLGDRANNEEMSMPEMLSLMTKAGSVIQNKVQAGDLDVERLQEQAMAFCQQIQHNPDLQNIIASNPVLAHMQLDAQAQTTGGASSSGEAPATPGIGGMLLSMMSSYQQGV